ncbi:hypothetical protein QJS10_CPA01g00173 [Acorus calamus]|uniref:Uncharacterized protein n=1 Tax=Acorus calamus TaxID=4465 RepID=A0AAV9FKP4_ACOCL|nr:hypothetical protein QJS10_CPA01g00173 [Acorus calamus]
MSLPPETDEYIRESIEHSLGLNVSTKTLQLKLLASEESRRRLQNELFQLHDRLREREERLERSKSEASMNAQALRKFIEEKEMMSSKYAEVLDQCSKWEEECALYHRDRELLEAFGNEADERARCFEARAHEVEEDVKRTSEELAYYKHEVEVYSENEARVTEELRVLHERIGELEQLGSQGNGEGGICSQCIRLKQDNEELRARLPETVSIIALAAEIESLKKDKENLKFNLSRAEEEHWSLTSVITNLYKVTLLSKQSSMLDEENKKLQKQLYKERQRQGSGGKLSSVSAKPLLGCQGKRKASPRIDRTPVEREIDFSGSESPRRPLSPMQQNSPDSRMHKK